MLNPKHQIYITDGKDLNDFANYEDWRFVALANGDCMEQLLYVNQESAHLVVTDPPYFLDGLDTAWKKGKGGPRGTGSVGGLPVGMKFDPQKGRELQIFIEKVGTLLLRAMKPGAFAAVFSQPRLAHRMAVGLEDAGFEIRDLLAWHYTRRAQAKAFTMDHFVRRMKKSPEEQKAIITELNGRKTPQIRPQFEAIIIAQKPKIGTFVDNWLKHKTGLMDMSVKLNGSSPSTVVTVEKPHREHYNGHLTVKPAQLIEHLIKIMSAPGQTVLDPFIGSGTTAVAAIKSHRSCIGIDINPEYIKIAQRRVNDTINADQKNTRAGAGNGRFSTKAARPNGGISPRRSCPRRPFGSETRRRLLGDSNH